MAEKRNYEQFRGLLRGAICDRTQAQFARESGISPEHLSRMLNNPEINRPNQATLGKIAAAAKNGVTLQDLLDALDMGDGTKGHPSPMRRAQAAEDFAPDFRESAYASMDMLAHVLSLEHWPAVTESPEQCAEAIVSAVNEQDGNAGQEQAAVAYDCGVCRNYIGTRLENVEKYMPVYLSMAGREEAAEALMIVFYNEMKCADGKTRAVVQDAACSVEAIEDLYGTPRTAMEQAEKILGGEAPWPDWVGCSKDEITMENGDGEPVEPDGEAVAMAVAHGMPYDIRFEPLKRFIERYHGKGSSPEERVLASIFGEKARWPETVSGFGFWIDGKNPPEKLAAFLSDPTHKKHAMDNYDPDGSNDEQGRYEDLERLLGSGMDALGIASGLEAFEYQDPGMLDDAGWGSAVATAMRAETGFAFAYHKAAEDQGEFAGLSEKGCILVADADAAGISREALILATCRYAKALGIRTFGDILFTGVHEEFRKPMTYTVREREPGEDGDMPEEDGPGWTEFDPKDKSTHPKEAGGYLCELKDGRTTELFWIPKPGIWLRAHKEWSHMVARYVDQVRGPGDEDEES